MSIQSRVGRSLCLGVFALTGVSSAGLAQDCITPLFMERADIRGLGLAEVTTDSMHVSVYGYAEYPTTCVRDDTMFEAASLTKPVVAYLTMRLVDRGRLTLDDVLLERLSTLPIPGDDPRAMKVSVRMALSHCTGLEGPDDQMLRFVEEPGDVFRYYPAGYRLVQRVLEELEGITLDELAQREVFGPLGMTSSSLVYRPEFAGRLASRHRMLGEPIPRNFDPDRPANAAASLMTTPADYGRFLQAMLNGTGLSDASRDAMLTPQVLDAQSVGAVGWGIGWGLEIERGTFFHWGDDGAAKCFTIGDPRTGRAFVYFTNSSSGMSIAADMASRFFPGASPSVTRLGYLNWDAPQRLAQRDVLRDHIEGGAEAGMQTFRRYETAYPDLDMYAIARFVTWILGDRSLHAERIPLLKWQVDQQPDNIEPSLNLADSLRMTADDDTAVAVLRSVQRKVDAEFAAIIGGRISWINDERLARANTDANSEIANESLAGLYDVRRVTSEADGLYYQRGDGPTSRLRWMHGTTYALESSQTFRIRFVMKDGRAVRIIGLYADGRTDDSPRDD